MMRYKCWEDEEGFAWTAKWDEEKVLIETTKYDGLNREKRSGALYVRGGVDMARERFENLPGTEMKENAYIRYVSLFSDCKRAAGSITV